MLVGRLAEPHRSDIFAGKRRNAEDVAAAPSEANFSVTHCLLRAFVITGSGYFIFVYVIISLISKLHKQAGR